MTLKRKRSSSELSSSPSLPSSSPIRPEGMDFEFAPISPMPAMFSRSSMMPSHPSGRTMKRFRNNRPSDELVHERTLGILYAAQKSDSIAPYGYSPADSVVSQESSIPNRAQSKQRSLHSFWNIKSAPNPVSLSPLAEQSSVPIPNCEDCGLDLQHPDGGMDLDDLGMGTDHACGACGKHVCFHCSISQLGDRRRCLQCAGQRAPRGAMAWPGRSIFT